jgi:hypothetical protein
MELKPIPKADPQRRKQLIAALTAGGYQPIGTKSKLYQAFQWTRPDDGAEFTYFVGRDAELRMSRTATLSDSISVKGLEAYDRLLEQGRELLKEKV